MPPFGQPEFTIAVKTMRGHVVWNPPRDLGQTPVLISFQFVPPQRPGLRTPAQVETWLWTATG